MKPKPLFLILCFGIIVSCNKSNLEEFSISSQTDHAVLSDTAKIALIDMGNRTYLGYTGYLYPNLSNVPTGHYANDLHDFATSIVPLDASGNVNTRKGKVGFIGVGASTCAILMNALRGITKGNPLTNSKLQMATCTDGGTSLNEIMDPNNATFWNVVGQKLSQNNLTFSQVEVIYFETDDSVNTNGFPERPLRTKNELEQALRTFKIKFPNIQLVYVLGRTTSFLSPRTKVTNVEPCPYYNGWACKWAIEDQINGVAGTEYKGLNAVAPMITWGWYEWADGTTIPRSDGFTWQRYETTDGLHANDIGKDTLAVRFQNFLLTDQYANIWYANH